MEDVEFNMNSGDYDSPNADLECDTITTNLILINTMKIFMYNNNCNIIQFNTTATINIIIIPNKICLNPSVTPIYGMVCICSYMTLPFIFAQV